MIYTLPECVEIGGAECPIRWDYRSALDICAALSDPELSEEERCFIVLDIFYPNLDELPPERYQEAVDRCLWFINCGEDRQAAQTSPRLIDWEQDFPLIAPPVNRALGREIRSKEPLHWWSFVGAYQEIGDCTFAQVVRIRERLARGKPLDKSDREWYHRNRHLVDFKRKYTHAEEDVLNAWGAADAAGG